jgi:hypothetical protein
MAAIDTADTRDHSRLTPGQARQMGIRTPETIAPARAPWAIEQRKAEGLPLYPTPRKAPAPASGRCSLRLSINGVSYRVRPIRPEAFGGIRAFRLTKGDGATHDVSLDVHGAACTCGDWTFRREGIDPTGCKHIRAAKACGLL